MTEDPFEELFEGDNPFGSLIEFAVALWDAIPLFVWILVAIFLVSIINDLLSTDHTGQTSSDRETTDRHHGPSREEYSIHDGIEDRTYRPPSEDDPIVVTNEVDRGILATIRRIAGLGRSRSRVR